MTQANGQGDTPRLRVVLAEPSPIVRGWLAATLTDHGRGDIEVAAQVSTGSQALQAMAQYRPDIALLAPDLAYPGTLDVARRIMAESPTPLVVVATAPIDDAQAASLLQAGVLDVLPRPPAHAGPQEWDTFGASLRAQVRLAAGIKVIRHVTGARFRPSSGRFLAVAEPTAQPPPPSGLAYVAIVASTGGPPALATVLRSFPHDQQACALVVQHTGAPFVQHLAEWLTRETAHTVLVARDGERPQAGCTYLAPGGAHLVLLDGLLRLDQSAPTHYLRPSGDMLLSSLAAAAASHSVGVVLTGIGADGAHGLAALRRAGGWTIAQDESSSAVWGMPRAAVQAGAACDVLPLARIGPRIHELLVHVTSGAPGWR